VADGERPFHPGALAPNWKRILYVDASLGVAVFVAGLIVAVVWVPVVGASIGALGGAYTWMVWRRSRDWRAQRRAAGLDDSPE
jgi:hypothetical protein